MSTDRALIRKTSAVYAEVLLQAAREEGTIFEVSEQLEQVLAAVRGTIELRHTLTDRMIPAALRSRIAKEVFASFDAALVEVLGVMVERDDVLLLNRVGEIYIDLAERELNSIIIDVTTVVELDDALRSSIQKKYSAQLGKGVLLREHVNPALVGGIVLSAHGQRIDASVASQLENARVVLSTVSSGGGR
jgi:F-type H+-transporting ATPase subunit delta